MVTSERTEGEKWAEGIIRNNGQNFSNFVKDVDLYIQDAQQTQAG